MEKSTHSAEYDALRGQLRTTRETAGLTQRDLAKRLKVTPSWVAKVEIGERRIDLVEFCWFVSACDADPVPISARLLRQFIKGSNSRKAKGGHAK